MITKLIWPKCRLTDDKNSFWVGCTDDEVIKQIIPHLTGNKELQIDTLKHNRGPNNMEEMQDEVMFNNFFLISADGINIISYAWQMPYSGLWNASNPFRMIDKEVISNINDLEKLEERLESEGRFNVETDETDETFDDI